MRTMNESMRSAMKSPRFYSAEKLDWQRAYSGQASLTRSLSVLVCQCALLEPLGKEGPSDHGAVTQTCR